MTALIETGDTTLRKPSLFLPTIYLQFTYNFLPLLSLHHRHFTNNIVDKSTTSGVLA